MNNLLVRSRLVLASLAVAACAPTIITGSPSVDAGADAAPVVDTGTPPPDAETLDVQVGRDAAARDAMVAPDADLPDGFVVDDVLVEDGATDAGDDVPTTDAVDVDGGPADGGVADVVIPPTDVVTPTDTGVPPSDAGAAGCTSPARALGVPADRVTGTVSGASHLTASCAQTDGPEVVHTLHLAARTGVQLSTDASFDSVLSVRRSCTDAMSEVGCNDDTPGSHNSYLRRVLDPGDYAVIVDEYGGAGGTGGTYTLDLATFTPAANADCGAPGMLSATTPTTGDTTTGLASSNACATDQWGPQLFYAVSVPAGQRATFTATPSGAPWAATVRVRTACADTVCLGAATSATAGAGAAAHWDNRGAAASTVIVSVSAASGFTGGAFSLATSFAPVPSAPANAACTTARTLMDGSALADEDATLGSTRLNGVCLNGAQGGSLFYRMTLPPQATGVVTVTPSTSWNIVVRALDACDSRACSASVDNAGAGQPETLSYVNSGTTARDVIFAVGATDPAGGGHFSLAASIVPPPTNVTCSAAATLGATEHRTLQNSAASGDNATGACLPAATGTVLWYRAVVPAGQTLAVRATPDGAMDPVIRVLPACGATSCLANANGAGARTAEALAWTNSGTADQTVFVAVGGATNAANGTFTLDATIARQYQETVIAPACDDMTGGAPITAVNGDDTTSAALDLPFAFTFFGQRMLEYSVSSNGLLQLYASLTGATPSNSYDNQSIPTAAAPNGFVAPLWDDLVPSAGSQVLTRTLGAAPDRRFVVQWTQFAFFGDNAARLTFQAKLFENGGAVELHYCAITPGMDVMRASGNSATVGIESPDGTRGRQHSFNDATGVSTTRALRIVP